MNKEEPTRAHAERTKKRIEKVQSGVEDHIDSNGLPPRNEIHQQKKKKTKLKLKYPVIRILALFFILLPIVSFSIYTINENKKTNPVGTVVNDRSDYEVVDVEVEKKDETKADREEDAQTSPNELINQPTTVEDIELGGSSDISSTPDPKDKNSPAKKANKEVKFKYHKVQPDETLFKISMKYYHTQSGIDRIKDANGIQGNEILVGQTLKIPIN